MTTRVACAQSPAVHRRHRGKPHNLPVAIEEAAGDGAQIVVLPELASSGYVFADRAELSSLAETRDGPCDRRMGEPRRGVADSRSSAGSPRRRATLSTTARPSSTRPVCEASTARHTCGTARTPCSTAATTYRMVVDTEHGRIGVMLCYDIEFPEWVRAVALSGADLLCAPVNWPLLPRPAGRTADRDGAGAGGCRDEPDADRGV